MNILSRLLCAALLFAGTSAAAAPMPPSLADLAAQVLPAVVSIASTDPVNDTMIAAGDDDNGGDEAAPTTPSDDSTADTGTVIPPPKAVEALGSGFVFDPAGYILTNNHVIDGASSVTVTFQDGTILPATIVGRDKAADLAVLKVDAGHQAAVPDLRRFRQNARRRLGDGDRQPVRPAGQHLGRDCQRAATATLIRGITTISSRRMRPSTAAIPAARCSIWTGEVIGVNSAIYSPSGASDGIGFAIPSAMVAPVAQALKTNGVMTRGWLGVATEEVTPQIQNLLDLPNTAGALIGAVSTGSPADGKLQPGDVLVSLGGVPVKNPRALLVRTAEIPAGQLAEAQYWRDGTRTRGNAHDQRAPRRVG